MTISILKGDCRDVLRTLPDESVHCVVTSPPYWGLRDYGTAIWEGGDPNCDHMETRAFVNPKNTLGPNGFLPATNAANMMHQKQFRQLCGKCQAISIDRQLGLEEFLGDHVSNMVEVFREVRRVLRKDGTLWLNYGDSYATQINGRSAHDTKLKGNDDRTFRDKPFSTIQGNLKPKDLCGIPWRVAFALQADGWYLRQDIIWSKPNPMPESVRDRCTKAHEYIFLLSKSERYYYDAEAIREPHMDPERWLSKEPSQKYGGNRVPGREKEQYITGWHKSEESGNPLGRNKRSVWEIATAPYSEAHFATFPPALIEPCIKAGCPEKACAKCGAPWVRETETSYDDLRASGSGTGFSYGKDGRASSNRLPLQKKNVETLGFVPSCRCDVSTTAGTCLDPFGGAGTTGLVADRLGRNAILIELNPEYAVMAERRIRSDAGMFAHIEAAE